MIPKFSLLKVAAVFFGLSFATVSSSLAIGASASSIDTGRAQLSKLLSGCIQGTKNAGFTKNVNHGVYTVFAEQGSYQAVIRASSAHRIVVVVVVGPNTDAASSKVDRLRAAIVNRLHRLGIRAS